MNLTKITLQGFKSFADRLEIDFTAGITCIVGPNGCGKSNVADAIRWVLGEKNAKMLRGDTMTDVIFGGTVNRKSLSYCEVALYFDNTDRYYRIDAEEVIVSRRLFRASGSEYYINGQTVRLRDIIELFRDTGIGKEGYSIIGQGKTTELLSKKPEERRKIFEEAAGVATFRVRKEEAEKQLDKARANKANLYSVMTEISDFLVPLEKQAKDALRVRELREELKVIEVNTYLHQSEDSSGVTSKLQDSYNSICKDIENKEGEDAETVKAHNLAFADLNNIDIIADRKKNERTELLISKEKAAGANKLYTEKISRAKEELQKISDDITSNTAIVESKTKEKEDKEIAKQKKTQEFIQLNIEYKKLEDDYKAFADTVNQKEREVERSREIIMESQDALTNAKSSTVGLTAKRDILLESLGDDKEAIKEKRSKLAAAKKELENYAAQLKECEADMAEKLKELDVANTNLKNCLTELDETNIRLREKEREGLTLETRITWLSERKNRLDNYADSVKSLVQAASDDLELNGCIVGVVGEMITAPRDLQLPIEIALGGAIQNIVTNTQRDAAVLIDFLRSNDLGRATFFPLDAVKPNNLTDDRVLDEDGVLGVASDLIKYDRKIYNVISNLLGRTVIAESKDIAARIIKKYNFQFRVVTVDGALYQQSGAISGGKEPKKDARILGRDAELEEAKKKIAATERAISAIKEDLKDKTEESKNLQAAKNIIASQMDKINLQVATIKANVEAKNNECLTIEEDEKQIVGQNQETLDKIKQLEELIADSSKKEEHVVSKKLEANDFLDAMKNEVFELRQKRDSMADSVADFKVKLNSVDNELTVFEREIARLTSEISYSEASKIAMLARKKTVETELAEAENNIDIAAFSAEDQAKIEELRIEIEKIKAYNEELKVTIQNLSEKRSVIAKELSQLNGRKASVAAKLEKLNEDLLAMETRIVEDYHLTKEDAEAFRVEDFDVSNALSNAAKVRRRIDSFGAINELAVEDFAEKSQRLTDFKTQYEDVEKAEADLVRIIEELTKEMEQVFLDAFNAINTNFQSIYAELFEGGRANLAIDLSDTDSVLDAPIDIFAQPKGKRLEKISLLSGGEQSLTAIAILFAIIQLKPMPFCVLDEIEAALDDVNTTLFINYLKKYAGKTQFIIITHKKPTMEKADVLYGITMQEVGVSTVVSVQLGDAVKFAQPE